MAQSTATNIKRKIQTLKEELDLKDKEIEDLQGRVKNAEDRADSVRVHITDTALQIYNIQFCYCMHGCMYDRGHVNIFDS